MLLAQKQTRRPTDYNKDADINPHNYRQLIFDKEAQSK
jgi:hypothetical protein